MDAREKLEITKIFQTSENILKMLSLWAVRIGSVVLILMMLLVFIDVFLRYIFNSPVVGSVEIVEVMMVLVVALGIAYTGINKGHISVDLLVSRFPQRVQTVIDILNSLVATIIFSIMSWKTGLQALVAGSRNVTTTVLEVPIYPFVWTLSMCTGLLSLVFLLQFLEAIIKMVKK